MFWPSELQAEFPPFVAMHEALYGWFLKNKPEVLWKNGSRANPWFLLEGKK